MMRKALPMKRMLVLPFFPTSLRIIIGSSIFQLGITKRLRLRINRRIAMEAQEARPVVSSFAREGTGGVDVAGGFGDWLAARVADQGGGAITIAEGGGSAGASGGGRGSVWWVGRGVVVCS
mmetsp:Transcript_10443/g.18496  ORF Transcript_10443/g.18496 Transcript_10443/m.18496 type:complete len:121 (+) Transcript_10443:1642-2004(+)